MEGTNNGKALTENQLLYFNDINGATGDFSLPPMNGEDLARFSLFNN